jgi:hypothetical protein
MNGPSTILPANASFTGGSRTTLALHLAVDQELDFVRHLSQQHFEAVQLLAAARYGFMVTGEAFGVLLHRSRVLLQHLPLQLLHFDNRYQIASLHLLNLRDTLERLFEARYVITVAIRHSASPSSGRLAHCRACGPGV